MADTSAAGRQNSGPPQPKRQHYVPREYIRPFLGSDGLIRVIDLESQREFRTSVGNAAVEMYFYDLEIEGERLSAEEFLSLLEGEAWPVIRQLDSDPQSVTSLSEEQERALARFIASFRFRTPAFRQWEQGLVHSLVQEKKKIVKNMVYAKFNGKEASEIWQRLDREPEQAWIHESGPKQPASTAIYMLAQVEGFGNLIRAMPWRIGRTSGGLRLYTSDNPVAEYLKPVRQWWETGAFASFTYYFPLAPDTLLKISPLVDRDEAAKAPNPQGGRLYRDFSDYEVSIARHVITRSATKYLYGEGLIVPRRCATECLERIDRFNLQFAMKYQGFDPRPPHSDDDDDE